MANQKTPAQIAAQQDAATHAARRQSELDRVAAMSPEERAAEQAGFIARTAALDDPERAEILALLPMAANFYRDRFGRIGAMLRHADSDGWIGAPLLALRGALDVAEDLPLLDPSDHDCGKAGIVAREGDMIVACIEGANGGVLHFPLSVAEFDIAPFCGG